MLRDKTFSARENHKKYSLISTFTQTFLRIGGKSQTCWRHQLKGYMQQGGRTQGMAVTTKYCSTLWSYQKVFSQGSGGFSIEATV